MLLFCCAEPPGELLFGSDWLKQVWRVSVTYSATCCCGHLGPGCILAFVRKSAQIMAEKSSQQLHEVFFFVFAGELFGTFRIFCTERYIIYYFLTCKICSFTIIYGVRNMLCI